MRIKEENEQKVVFSILEDVYKPTAMFFGLTNLPVIFQAIINDFLRDIIEVGDVVAFINDVMVGTETEVGHNNIVKEVSRRIIENNLFVKLEKYV